MATVTVRANLPVLSIGRGDVVTIEATELVGQLLATGALEHADLDSTPPPPPPPPGLVDGSDGPDDIED
jgi:hypothetical protein